MAQFPAAAERESLESLVESVLRPHVARPEHRGTAVAVRTPTERRVFTFGVLDRKSRAPVDEATIF